MSISEFALIQNYFSKQTIVNPVNKLGVGDDCALMSVPEGYELAVTTDTMVEGVHFFAGTDPKLIGHKLLAVNLSDLAAMGASPVSITLALTIPQVDKIWLEGFSSGLLDLAKQYSVDLIGGDTTAGALTLSVQAFGLVKKGRGLLRSAAKAGDFIYVTGSLGDAGLGLKIEQGYLCGSPNHALQKFHRPMPRIKDGLAIKNYANACIDLSDGVASDLRHILDKSGVGAKLDWDKIPLSKEVVEYTKQMEHWQFPLSAGEDYELCFTVSPENVDLINIDCTQIGVIESEIGLRVQRFGEIELIDEKGFEHFS